MRTKIYTKTGDSGETTLIGGQRVSKADVRLEGYGTIDELNSCLGICINLFAGVTGPLAHQLLPIFNRIQNDLFIMGSHLACENEKMRPQLPELQSDFSPLLEKSIDEMTNELPELRDFILPGGHELASHIHLARSVCRRAERWVCHMEEAPHVDEVIIQLNRLSDFLFVAARFVNHKTSTSEVKWEKPK